jgi:hypothetical protein
MKVWIAIVALAVALPGASLAASPGDADGDGVPDAIDKCTLDSRNAAPSANCDTDGDGYGNVCDPDFDQNFAVNANDYTRYFVPSFKSHVPASTGTDMDCDGKVTKKDDEAFFVPKFKGDAKLGGAVPGPSGLPCAGTPGCM